MLVPYKSLVPPPTPLSTAILASFGLPLWALAGQERTVELENVVQTLKGHEKSWQFVSCCTGHWAQPALSFAAMQHRPVVLREGEQLTCQLHLGGLYQQAISAR